jgi:hypothetical protein
VILNRFSSVGKRRENLHADGSEDAVAITKEELVPGCNHADESRLSDMKIRHRAKGVKLLFAHKHEPKGVKQKRGELKTTSK